MEDFIGDKFRIMSSVMPVALFEGRYRNYRECLEAAVEAGADRRRPLTCPFLQRRESAPPRRC